MSVSSSQFLFLRASGRRECVSVKSVKFILDVAIKEKAIFYFSRNSPLSGARAASPFLSTYMMFGETFDHQLETNHQSYTKCLYVYTI